MFLTLLSWISIRTSGFLPHPPPAREPLLTCFTGVCDGELWGVHLHTHKHALLIHTAVFIRSMILNQEWPNSKYAPSTASWWWGQCSTTEVFSSIEVPHYRDLFDQVSDFRHREVKRTPIRAAALQRHTEMFFPHKDGFRDQLLYHRLLILFLADKTL